MFDEEYNRKLAGLFGANCYNKGDINSLFQKSNQALQRIGEKVVKSGHHSCFGHSHVILGIEDIPKALAMVLNNEKEYNTSEKSARYVPIENGSEKEIAVYNKWVDKFTKLIGKKYGYVFNKESVHKLAQENARYLISIYTPTIMIYSTSYRQLNYICGWLEKQIKEPENEFYEKMVNSMSEFVCQIKGLGLCDELLSIDGK